MLCTHGEHFMKDGERFIPKGVNFSEPWLIEESDFAECKSVGVNTVRVWCKSQYWKMEQESFGKRPPFSIRHILQMANKHGIEVVLVLGEVGNKPSNTMKPWTNRFQRAEVIDFRESLLQSVGHFRSLAAIEFVNEPQEDRDLKAYRSFAHGIVDMANHFNPELLVGVPALDVGSPSGLRQEIAIDNRNVYYAFNFYDPYAVTHTKPPTPWPHGIWNKHRMEKQIDIALNFSKRLKQPVLCGELGCLLHAPGKSELRWLETALSALDQRGIGWLYWGWKGFRSIGFHLYYNRIDQQLPPEFERWEDAYQIVSRHI